MREEGKLKTTVELNDKQLNSFATNLSFILTGNLKLVTQKCFGGRR
jgi:hypothetical protein